MQYNDIKKDVLEWTDRHNIKDVNVIINKTESQSSFSFRWGKTGAEAKIYFSDLDELKSKIEVVKVAIQESIAIKEGLLESSTGNVGVKPL